MSLRESSTLHWVLNRTRRMAIGWLLTAFVFTSSSLAGLVSHWPFDTAPGGITPDVIDSNPGTLVNSPALVSSPMGNALSFDGGFRYVDLGVKANLNPPNTFTIQVWV